MPENRIFLQSFVVQFLIYILSALIFVIVYARMIEIYLMVSLAPISKRQKELEARLGEIAVLKKHIINYSKTRETYSEYRKRGYSKKFFEEYRGEITLHKAAKEAFSQIKGPVPKIRELNEEYERVLREKKQTYAEYRQARQDMKDYQTAKYNVEQFLGKEEDERQAETRKRTEKVR